MKILLRTHGAVRCGFDKKRIMKNNAYENVFIRDFLIRYCCCWCLVWPLRSFFKYVLSNHHHEAKHSSHLLVVTTIFVATVLVRARGENIHILNVIQCERAKQTIRPSHTCIYWYIRFIHSFHLPIASHKFRYICYGCQHAYESS